MKNNYRFFKSGPVIRFADIDPDSVLKEIPPAVYKIIVIDSKPALLKLHDKFTLPKKLFGEPIQKYVSQIGKAYGKTTVPLGVMMTGRKGSGKTILSKYVANEFITKYEKPVFFIDYGIPVEIISTVARTIGEACFIFEEFAKRQSSRDSNGDIINDDSYLSYFENAELGKILNIITENKASDISTYMHGRTSRMKFHFRFTNTDPTEISDCFDYYGTPVSHRGYIHGLVVSCSLNIDLLSTICQDIKEDESILDDFDSFLSTLNIENYSAPGLNIKSLDCFEKTNWDWVVNDIQVSIESDMSIRASFGDEVHVIEPKDINASDNIIRFESFAMAIELCGKDRDIIISKKTIIEKIKELIED